jgi:hypothetical protein
VGSFFVGGEKQAVEKIAEEGWTRAGEELYVGTHNSSKYWSVKTGLWRTHVPHHVVQDAVSGTSTGKGITILIPKRIHNALSTTRKAARKGLSLRRHLAADVKELRNALRSNGYNRSIVNRQLREVIRRNKAIGGFAKERP